MERADFDSRTNQSCAVAVGFFDGVHRGHKAVIRRLIDVAREASLPSAVVCFVPTDHSCDKHSSAFSASDSEVGSESEEKSDAGEARFLLQTTQTQHHGIRRLCTFQDCVEMILALGVEIIITMPWSGESPFSLSASANDDCASQCDTCNQRVNDEVHALLEQIGARILVTGNPGHFALEGVQTVKVETVMQDGFPVTTDRILEALRHGKPEKANELLERAHHYCGRVIPGARRGRTVGMPTANMVVSPELQLPAFGVYATRIKVRNRWYNSLSNIGTRPTVDPSNKVTIETHILDFDDAIYGEEVKLEIYTYIRPTIKFDSFVDVRDQVKRDIASARIELDQRFNH